MPEILKPIFIVGAPRSGTTLLYDYIACHDALGWFSQHDYRNYFTKEHWEFLNLRRRLYGIFNWHYSTVNEDRLRTRIEIPDEFGIFWHRWFGTEGWVSEDDVNNSIIQNITQAIANLLERKNKKRFLTKSPVHSVRMGAIKKIFPDSFFINIIRDGRAVVSSMMRAVGTGTKRPSQYFGVPLKNNDQMQYDLLERHARQWVEVNEEIQKTRINLDQNQYFEMKYEDFVEKPKQHMKEIFKFCELDYQDIFEKPRVRFYARQFLTVSDKLQSRNEIWEKFFSESDIKRLDNIMGESLHRFEYS